jgi:hypothetical protein
MKVYVALAVVSALLLSCAVKPLLGTAVASMERNVSAQLRGDATK